MKYNASERLWQMKSLRSGDFEVQHSQADELLCEIILDLTRDLDDADEWVNVIHAYDDLEKWYA